MTKPDVCRLLRVILCVCSAVGVAACKPQGGSTAETPHGLPTDGQLGSLPLGDLAGAAESTASQNIKNPFEGNKEAAADGHKLFIAMNCAGCHGYDAKGGMGPDLTDAYWRYGGTPGAIYRSIFEGRPQGMPSWGRALPPQEIWKIVAFVQTLGGAVQAHEYHAGLQGDHNVTSVAPEIHDLGPTFNQPGPNTSPDGAAPPKPPGTK